jgi:hypothetical protein
MLRKPFEDYQDSINIYYYSGALGGKSTALESILAICKIHLKPG